MMGKDFESPLPGSKKTLASMVQYATFPYSQGTPNLAAITAKARALDCVTKPEFKKTASRIVEGARALADEFNRRGYKVMTGGTDNHLLLIDILTSRDVTGLIAERVLEECNIVINKNRIQGDLKPPMITSGIRLGTNALALRGLGPQEMVHCVDLIDRILSATKMVDDRSYELEDTVKKESLQKVKDLCTQFPLPNF